MQSKWVVTVVTMLACNLESPDLMTFQRYVFLFNLQIKQYNELDWVMKR